MGGIFSCDSDVCRVGLGIAVFILSAIIGWSLYLLRRR